jgi:hypothetical protein
MARLCYFYSFNIILERLQDNDYYKEIVPQLIKFGNLNFLKIQISKLVRVRDYLT